MTRLAFSLLIMAAAWFDMGYTIWAVRRYHFGEWNYMWRRAIHHPVWFVVEFTAYHIAALAVCWISFPLELYWIVLAVRLFYNAKNINAVRRVR
jgi:hypothetical protein